MKVLLKEDVENLGYAGEVHKVADGYGRNYLLPNNMAVMASPGMMKQAEVWRKKAEARRAEKRAEFEALAASIEGVRLTFTARAGAPGARRVPDPHPDGDAQRSGKDQCGWYLTAEQCLHGMLRVGDSKVGSTRNSTVIG